MMAVFRHLDPALGRSITLDNDSCAAQPARSMGIETATGRLRRWPPRQTDLNTVSDEGTLETVMTYTLTPTTRLGYTIPTQTLFKRLGRDVRLHLA
ncbi:MAG: hypothetical protein AAFU49_11930 [Pseudomonadota bacterium]